MEIQSDYRITSGTPHTFIQCSNYVKEGLRVKNGYINKNFFTSMPRGRVGGIPIHISILVML